MDHVELQFDNNSQKTIDLDITEGIPCTEWPVAAQEWVTRQENLLRNGIFQFFKTQ
jgi:hypothetical protein